MTIVIDRRTTLAWLAAALTVLPEASRGSGLAGTQWPTIALTPVTAPGYGVDPDLSNPVVPWPLTMTPAERTATAALCDMILPADGTASAASAVGVPAFIDEWISAPYRWQVADRALIVPGLAWLDAESRARSGATFAVAVPAVRAAICDDIAYRDRIRRGYDRPATFFAAMRRLTLNAYFATEEGWAQIGYLGNTPIDGPYPGPTPEAAAHIAAVIARLGLPAG